MFFLEKVPTATGFPHLLPLLLLPFVIVALRAFYYAIYNIYLNPLSKIPGPKLAAFSRIPWARHMHNGTLNDYVTSLHKTYGDVVRLAPNEVSFISGDTAWQDIYGPHVGKKSKVGKTYLKDPNFFPLPPNGVNSIIAASEVDHSRQRRLVAHAFTADALKKQEYIIQSYVDLLIQRLHEAVRSGTGGKVDMLRWYNYTTFDVVADLTFGESFHCLRDKDYHPFVNMAFQTVKSFGIISIKRYLPIVNIASKFYKSQAALASRREFFKFVDSKIAWRLSMETARPDFMGYIMRHQDEKGMTQKEMESTLNSFMVAGSETSATMLSGTTLLLIQHPDKMIKLVDEIRSTFKDHNSITLEEVNKLTYLPAVINEGLRMYPPVPTGFPRVVPPGGDVISGHFIPEKTSVYVSQFAANHSERNFTDADSFIPERWLGDPRYTDNKFSVFNPFSFGPRNCLGKNLAAAEMRLVLAKMIFNFDLELHDDTVDDWFKQKVFILWDKPPLWIKLKPVVQHHA